MRFTTTLTVPASTPAGSPVSVACPVTYGRLVQTTLQFPFGSAGLLHVWIDRWEHRLYPTSPDVTFVGNDDVFTLPDDYLIDEEPLELTVAGYNDDDTFPHAVIVHFDVLPIGDVSRQAQRGLLGQLWAALGGE